MNQQIIDILQKAAKEINEILASDDSSADPRFSAQVYSECFWPDAVLFVADQEQKQRYWRSLNPTTKEFK